MLYGTLTTDALVFDFVPILVMNATNSSSNFDGISIVQVFTALQLFSTARGFERFETFKLIRR